jgi:signal peptidase II
MSMRFTRKARVFWPICLLLVLVDCTTKDIAVDRLYGAHAPYAMFDGLVRFTVAYNPYAAMGLSLGTFSRIGFSVAAVLALGVLGSLYLRTPARQTWQLVALALICGGAAGNLLDRIRSAHGVIDFIEIGIGTHRFGYVFNVADIGLSAGAVLLAAAMLRRSAPGETL